MAVQCKVTTRTLTDGERSEYRYVGALKKIPNGYSVVYRDHGDKVTLHVGERAFRVKREGQAGIALRFLSGRTTRGELQFEHAYGELFVKTERYTLREEQGNLSISLEYALQYPTHEQRIQMEITIENSEEK